MIFEGTTDLHSFSASHHIGIWLPGKKIVNGIIMYALLLTLLCVWGASAQLSYAIYGYYPEGESPMAVSFFKNALLFYVFITYSVIVGWLEHSCL